MNQFLLKNGCDELLPFPHIIEFGLKKHTTIRFDSLKAFAAEPLRFYFIIEGKFEWVINDQQYVLYPGDLAIILPGQMLGGEKDIMHIGTVAWLHIRLEEFRNEGLPAIGNWSGLHSNEGGAIARILLLNKLPVLSNQKEAGLLFQKAGNEIFNQEIGYITRINQMIDELFILIARQLTRQNNLSRNFPQSFLLLEQTLRKNLSHQWTVEEMGALMGLGNTAFSEKVKSYTGFSPLNYLINIRISEALKLLKRPDVHVTDIAFTVGFYSSQHFATTFKKLTGYTPSEFRKKNIITP